MLRTPGRLAMVVLAGWGAGCRSGIDYEGIAPPPAAARSEPTGRTEVRRTVDEATGRTTHEWAVLVAPGLGAIKHGAERIWHEDGTLHWEREFRFGKPTGIWRSWYPNGNPRTECFFLGPDVERSMTFWREDGKLQAKGPACDGVRRGVWRFWWRNGRLHEEGEYRGGFREGVWMAWTEDGERRTERVYERNVRVSERAVETAEPPRPVEDAGDQ